MESENSDAKAIPERCTQHNMMLMMMESAFYYRNVTIPLLVLRPDFTSRGSRLLRCPCSW